MFSVTKILPFLKHGEDIPVCLMTGSEGAVLKKNLSVMYNSNFSEKSVQENFNKSRFSS